MSVLEFSSARMRVCIGCTAEERAVPQDVDLDVAIRFAAPPRACETDQLTDTVNYSDLIMAARDLCAKREFKLVEQLVNFVTHGLPSVEVLQKVDFPHVH